MAGPTDRLLWTAGYRRLARMILERDRHRCQIGGPRCTIAATEVDHVIPRADGGDVYDPANLRAACKRCNGRLSAQRTNAYRYANTAARYETRL